MLDEAIARSQQALYAIESSKFNQWISETHEYAQHCDAKLLEKHINATKETEALEQQLEELQSKIKRLNDELSELNNVEAKRLEKEQIKLNIDMLRTDIQALDLESGDYRQQIEAYKQDEAEKKASDPVSLQLVIYQALGIHAIADAGGQTGNVQLTGGHVQHTFNTTSYTPYYTAKHIWSSITPESGKV